MERGHTLPTNSTTTQAATTIANLRSALMDSQAAASISNEELNSLRLENAKLEAKIAAGCPTKGKGNKKLAQSPVLEEYAPELQKLANQFTLMDFPWVEPKVFMQPPPLVPTLPANERYQSDAATLLHMRHRLFESCPPHLHVYIEKLGDFGTNFLAYQSIQRSNAVSKIHKHGFEILSSQFPEITRDLCGTTAYELRASSDFCKKLYLHEDLRGNFTFKEILVPIIYAGCTVGARHIFQNEVLFQIGLLTIYGPSALGGKIVKNSQGRQWNLKAVSSGLIAWCCIAAIYILSHDHQFEERGPKTNIDYRSAFLQYKERIEKHENTPLFRQIINKWNSRLFNSEESDNEGVGEETTGADDIATQSAMIDAALSMGIYQWLDILHARCQRCLPGYTPATSPQLQS